MLSDHKLTRAEHSKNHRHSPLFQLLLRKIPGLIQLYRLILFCKQDLIFFAFKLQNAWFRKLVEEVRPGTSCSL